MTPRDTAWGAYKSIADALRTRITGGEFAPGTPLPSEAILTVEYGVARNTLRRALDQLTGEGLITTRPGRGRLVASPDTPPQYGPEYRRIAAELRTEIESGELQPGDALPSEAALMARYGVSRNTARQALTELEGAGLVDTIQGKGRFVRRH